METARALVSEVATQQPAPTPLSELIVGTECGGYDATSGTAANPTVGIVADWLVGQGATVLLGETAEFFGAEQTLARRARDKETAQRLYEIVARLEAEAQYVGESVAGTRRQRPLARMTLVGAPRRRWAVFARAGRRRCGRWWASRTGPPAPGWS